jgi:D-glycero-D-manno-heptose 1,7-bisphosphate phosphatase
MKKKGPETKTGEDNPLQPPPMIHHAVLPEGAEIDDEGLWVQLLRRPEGPALRPALFLDRDGVIVDEVDHLSQAADVRLIDGAAEVIAAANRRGFPVVVVTNQSGIGQGLFAWDAFIDVQNRILGDLAAEGAFVDGVFACPHHPKALPPYDHPDHPARKPNPGMLLRAAERLALDLSTSWIIGDRTRDLAAGRRAGLAGGLLVSTGYGGQQDEREAALALAKGGEFRVLVGASVAAALTTIPLFGGPR